MITKDLGIVTAYGYAVSKGYTGTEEEFAELMASYATVAEQAAQSAQTATQKASAAAQAVLDAVAEKDAAVQAKTDAENARDSAAGSASSASQSASSASGSASSASQSAGAAQTSAESAAGSATAASQSAADANTAKTDAQTAKTDAETAQGKAEEAQALAEEAAEELSAEVAQIETNKNDIAELKNSVADVIANTATGDIASFTDGADDYPVKDLVAHIEPVQSGSGDPSPDNVRPITGWTGANVTRTGKNLLPNKTCQWPENKLIIGDDQIREGIFLKQGIYTVSARRSKGKIFCKTSSGSNITLTPNSSALSGTLTVAKDDYYRFWIYDSSGFTSSDVEWFQLELGSTATDYEPYQGDTYAVTFPTEAGTVYGGTLDVTTGVLTVDKMGVSLNISDMDGTEAYPGWKNQNWIDNLAMGEYNYSSPSGSLSNISNISGYMFSVNRTTSVLYLRTDTYGLTQTEWKTQYPDLTMQIVYPLATPITYQCTPTEVKTLLGANNIFADTGSVNVEYCADTKKYIDNAIAAAVASLS